MRWTSVESVKNAIAEVNRIKRGKNQPSKGKDECLRVSCVRTDPAFSRSSSRQRSEIQMEVILDIGADLSCLPIASDSTSVKGPSAGRIAVRDA